MAAVSVVFDGQRLDDADALVGPNGDWEDTGGKAAALEPDFIYQGTYSISEKVGTTRLGVRYEHDTGNDMSGTPHAMIYKIGVTNPAVLLGLGAGLDLLMGDDTGGGVVADYYLYYVEGGGGGGGGDNTYPPLGGWLIRVIDPNEIAFRDALVGVAPTLSAVFEWGIFADFSGAAKVENVAMDAVDLVAYGEGLTLTGGDGANDPGTFQDFIDADEGLSTARWGIVVTKEGVLYVVTWLNLGTSTTAGRLTDSFKTIVFVASRAGEGFCGLGIDLSQSATDVQLINVSMKGRGKASKKLFFDTALEVDGGNEEIDIVGHGLETGDYVLYSKEGGSDAIGLTDATYYFVNTVTDDSIALYAVGATVGRQNAVTDTLRVGLTAATVPGENHSIKRDPDNRPDFTVAGTTGVQALLTCCELVAFRLLTLTSKATITGGCVINSGKITPSTAPITSVNFSGMTTEEGEEFIESIADLSDISECTFDGTGTEGHALEITAGATHSSENTYTGYWAPAVNGWKFNAQSGVNGTTEIITTSAAHGFSDGDAVYYNKQGGTLISGLTDLAKYYAGNTTATTLSLHATKAAAVAGTSKINLTAGLDEIQHLYSAHATILNSFGATTINVTTGSSVPSVRNAGNYEATVVASVDMIITVQDVDKDPIQNAQTSIQLLNSPFTQLMNEDTTALGVAQEGYGGSTPVDVIVKVRKSDDLDDPRYFAHSSIQEVTANGLTLLVTLEVNPFI